MKRKKCIVMVAVFVLSLAMTASAAVVIEYDASAVAGQRPEDTGGWTVSQGLGVDYTTVVQDAGDHLQVYTDYDADAYNGGDYANWTSTGTVSMVKGATDYAIEVKVQPLDDLISSGYSYEFANLRVQWSDNVNSYSMCFDLDSDDAGAGTTGGVCKWKYPITPVIGGVDWSSPHTVLASYSGASDEFDFYLDGVYQSTVASADFTGGYLPYTVGYQNKVNFGDSSGGGGDGTRGPDYDADYYFVRVYDTAVPEPATMVLLGLGGLAVLRRKK